MLRLDHPGDGGDGDEQNSQPVKTGKGHRLFHRSCFGQKVFGKAGSNASPNERQQNHQHPQGHPHGKICFMISKSQHMEQDIGQRLGTDQDPYRRAIPHLDCNHFPPDNSSHGHQKGTIDNSCWKARNPRAGQTQPAGDP